MLEGIEPTLVLVSAQQAQLLASCNPEAGSCAPDFYCSPDGSTQGCSPDSGCGPDEGGSDPPDPPISCGPDL